MIDNEKQLTSEIVTFIFDILPVKESALFKDSGYNIEDDSKTQRIRRLKKGTEISNRNWDETLSAILSSVDIFFSGDNDVEIILKSIFGAVIRSLQYIRMHDNNFKLNINLKTYLEFISVIIAHYFLKGQKKGLKDFSDTDCWYLNDDNEQPLQSVFSKLLKFSGCKPYSAAKKIYPNEDDADKMENLKRKMKRWLDGDSIPSSFFELEKILSSLEPDFKWFDTKEVWASRFKLAWTIQKFFKKVDTAFKDYSIEMVKRIQSMIPIISDEIESLSILRDLDYYAWFLKYSDNEFQQVLAKNKLQFDSEVFDIPIVKALVLFNYRNIFSDSEITEYFAANINVQSLFELRNINKIRKIIFCRFSDLISDQDL